MAYSTKLFFFFFFSVLVLCSVTVMAHQQKGAEENGKGLDLALAKRVCNLSPNNKDLCVTVLNSDPESPKVDLKDMAILALKVAAKNASAILTDVKRLINDDKLDPKIQQGLADCKETILDAESQLEDTIAALMGDADVDAKVWLKAALAAITTCDDSIPGNDDVLSVKSKYFRELCNIAIAITRALPPQDLSH